MQPCLFKTAPDTEIILASGSPRRKELLESLGLTITVSPSDIDEEAIKAPPAELVRELSELKAAASDASGAHQWVLAGDTIVVIDEKILGKPKSEEEAREMISRLSGREHSVFGGICLVNKAHEFSESLVIETKVEFEELSEEFIENYVAAGESMDKAGAYAVQGVGQSLVKAIRGSYTNVVGLDVPRVSRLLLEVGAIEWR